MLDGKGLRYVKIFASGDLDEYKIDELIRKGAKIDSFGVGTRMSTSYDRPYVDVVYKLSGKFEKGTFVPAMKLSKGKITLPGKKQVFRQKNKRGCYAKDIIGLADEEVEGEPLLVKVMEKGNIVYDLPSLEKIRENALKNLSRLPDEYRKLKNPALYRVELSPKLKKIKKMLTDQIKRVEGLS
jgi:nicotinate phosphoribosyltransferase